MIKPEVGRELFKHERGRLVEVIEETEREAEKSLKMARAYISVSKIGPDEEEFKYSSGAINLAVALVLMRYAKALKEGVESITEEYEEQMAVVLGDFDSPKYLELLEKAREAFGV